MIVIVIEWLLKKRQSTDYVIISDLQFQKQLKQQLTLSDNINDNFIFTIDSLSHWNIIDNDDWNKSYLKPLKR